ncbi:MAG: hypothetical protein COX07_06245, partial [Bacteroidetes bacterium CG23_combo_of_CG06-09_8_20_14_all_32_9]
NNIPAGTSINFTNQSTGVYDSLHWYFSGAVPDNSTANNPVGILYSTVGDFDVTLILFSSSCSNDTLTKPLYIHIFDPANVDSVKADFHAITSRLIIKGSTVKFEDLSQGDITQWQWSFEYGSPATSTVQNPPTITYPTPAVCDVCLIVSNGIFSDTLCKTEYIVVTSTEWPGGSFCDTISNILPSEHPLSFMHLTPTYWGYFPGHNQLIPKYYADKFVNYTFSEVSTLLVPVVKAYSAAPSNKVLFTIWDTNNQGLPGNVLGTKVEYINNFVPNYYGVVNFDSPVPVNGEFFVGFQLYYNTPVDTFVVYMAPDRGITGTNTLYIRKDPTSAWLTPSQFLSPMSVHTSFAIQVVGCLTVIGVEEIDMDSQVVVYPNPSSDKINIELFDVITNIFDCKIYDITGRSLYAEPLEINTNHYEIDLSRFNNGIYLLEITVNNQKIIKKISVIK